MIYLLFSNIDNLRENDINKINSVPTAREGFFYGIVYRHFAPTGQMFNLIIMDFVQALREPGII